MRIVHLLFLVFAIVSSIAIAGTPVETIIANARATIGTDAALDGLVTLRMSGIIKPAEPKLPIAQVLLIARKPCSQRLEVCVDNVMETTLLEGKSGCIIQSELDSPDKCPRLRMMTVEEVLRMAFNTRQLFNFYREDSYSGESISYEGIEQQQDILCHKLVYSHPDGVTITRYFSVNDYKLVSTITDKGVQSLEIGTQVVNGIKFPRRIEFYQRGELLHTIILKTIEVNKPLEVGIFTIPEVQETK